MLKFLLCLMSKWFRFGLFQQIQVLSLAEPVAYLGHPINPRLFKWRVPALIDILRCIRYCVYWILLWAGDFSERSLLKTGVMFCKKSEKQTMEFTESKTGFMSYKNWQQHRIETTQSDWMARALFCYISWVSRIIQLVWYQKKRK